MPVLEGHNSVDQSQRVHALILQSAHQGADVGSAGVHGHVGLLGRVNEVHVGHDSVLGQACTGFKAMQRNGNLEHRGFAVQAETQQAIGLIDNLLRGVA